MLDSTELNIMLNSWIRVDVWLETVKLADAFKAWSWMHYIYHLRYSRCFCVTKTTVGKVKSGKMTQYTTSADDMLKN